MATIDEQSDAAFEAFRARAEAEQVHFMFPTVKAAKPVWVAAIAWERARVKAEASRPEDLSDELQMVYDCETHESKLTDWERTFIDSIKNRLQGGRGLTDLQQGNLDKIWNRVT